MSNPGTPSQAVEKIRRSSLVNGWIALALLGLSAALLYRQAFWYAPLFDSNAEPRTVTARGDLADDEKSTIDLFRNAAPSVVHITTHTIGRSPFAGDVFTQPAGTGSGFIWDQNGHIVTNLHVIREAQLASVTLADNSSYLASLVGFDPSNDLAVLKVDVPPGRLTPITVGESYDLQVGQKVFAIGSPFEFDHTLTTGTIGGLNRSVPTSSGLIHGAIQADAAINPGNSGGPLLDSAGRLIGVNTAIASGSGGSHGIAFAIPVDLVNIVIPDLIRDGVITRTWLGVVVREQVVVGNRELPGVLVFRVIKGSPAERAGILPTRRQEGLTGILGDVILAIDGRRINRSRDLLDLLTRYRPGDSVTVTLLRGDDTLDVVAELEEIPEFIDPGRDLTPQQ